MGRHEPGSKGGEIHPQTLQEAEVGVIEGSKVVGFEFIESSHLSVQKM